MGSSARCPRKVQKDHVEGTVHAQHHTASLSQVLTQGWLRAGADPSSGLICKNGPVTTVTVIIVRLTGLERSWRTRPVPSVWGLHSLSPRDDRKVGGGITPLSGGRSRGTGQLRDLLKSPQPEAELGGEWAPSCSCSSPSWTVTELVPIPENPPLASCP